MLRVANIDVISRSFAKSRREIFRKNLFGGVLGSLLTNMTSATVPGAPGARDGKYQHHLQEVSFKSKRNRSKNFFRVFSGLLITNMTSAMVPGVLGALGGK